MERRSSSGRHHEAGTLPQAEGCAGRLAGDDRIVHRDLCDQAGGAPNRVGNDQGIVAGVEAGGITDAQRRGVNAGNPAVRSQRCAALLPLIEQWGGSVRLGRQDEARAKVQRLVRWLNGDAGRHQDIQRGRRGRDRAILVPHSRGILTRISGLDVLDGQRRARRAADPPTVRQPDLSFPPLIGQGAYAAGRNLEDGIRPVRDGEARRMQRDRRSLALAG